VLITTEVEGVFERFYGDEVMVVTTRGVRYVKKRDIAAIEEKPWLRLPASTSCPG
jgi:hypothetical protein